MERSWRQCKALTDIYDQTDHETDKQADSLTDNETDRQITI